MAKAKPRKKTAKKKVGPPLPPPDDPADIELSADEQRFVEEFLVDRNAARAYRTCFPHTNWHHARIRGYDMRHRPNVDREIRAAVHAQSIRTQITADRTLKEIARVAFSDIADLYDPTTHQLCHPRNIPFEARRAIASVKISRERRTESTRGSTHTEIVDTIVSYTLWPKMDALTKLCRHLGLSVEISPLEALLQALPRDLSDQVRKALAEPRTALPSTNGKPHSLEERV